MKADSRGVGAPVCPAPSPHPAKPLAIIIQGNPLFLNDPGVAPWADALHARIARVFTDKGWEVEMDLGAPLTQPRAGASAWIGHSRGADRLRFADPSIQTHALLALSNDGWDPSHYRLAPADLAALDRIASSFPPAAPSAAILPILQKSPRSDLLRPS